MLFTNCPSCFAPQLISICCFCTLSVRPWGQAPLLIKCRRGYEWDCVLPVSCTLMGVWEAEPQLLLLGKLLLGPWFTHSQIPRCCLWKQSTLKCLFCLKMRSRAELSAAKNYFIAPFIAFKRPRQKHKYHFCALFTMQEKRSFVLKNGALMFSPGFWRGFSLPG